MFIDHHYTLYKQKSCLNEKKVITQNMAPLINLDTS